MDAAIFGIIFIAGSLYLLYKEDKRHRRAPQTFTEEERRRYERKDG